MRWRAARGLTMLVALGLGCTPVLPSLAPLPLQASHEETWTYAAALLSRQGAADALPYFASLVDAVDVSDPALLARDVAEVRYFAGDLPGATAAAAEARRRLDAVSNSAQFTPDDRRIAEREVAALRLAAAGDLQQLSELANSDNSDVPAADPWYLLGTLYERGHDTLAARLAYEQYLRREPQWTYLRSAPSMRRHAAGFLAS